MAHHDIRTTDAEIDKAIHKARLMADEPRAIQVAYRAGPGLNLFILTFSDGQRRVIPRESLQGLEGATRRQIERVEIIGRGTGLHWPLLSVDHYVPALLREIYGTKDWLAAIGRRGGSVTSTAKRKAARANGKKGGRPRAVSA